jgi:hypothetical protein
MTPGLVHARRASNRHLPEICQKALTVVVNCATRNLALPHDPTLGSPFHLRDRVST